MDYSNDDPNGWGLTDYGGNFAPESANSSAGSWTDVLKYGFTRAIDNAIPQNVPQNTRATYNTSPTSVRAPESSAGAFGLSGSTILLGVLALGGLLVAAKMLKAG